MFPLLHQRSLNGHANLWYVPALRCIAEDGAPVVARGRSTHEILHVRTTLPDPRKRVLTVPFRRANPFFQAAETVWILAGRQDAAWILNYNSQLVHFLDPDPREDDGRSRNFHAAYGHRLRRAVEWDLDDEGVDQLADVLTQLRLDPGSRRAVATIHDPGLDHAGVQTLDRPCNIAFSWQQREGALWAATFNRSNDLNLGLAFTNLVQFTTIQEFLAAGLGLTPGVYTHFSSSLHTYDDDPIVARVLGRQQEEFDVYRYVEPTAMMLWPAGEPDYGFHLIERMASADSPLWPDGARCPYWRSVLHMLLAWDFLKAEDLTSAAREVSVMAAKDWQVACWEYLHRWACRRQRRVEFLNLMPLVDHTFPRALRDYIVHDDGRDL